MDFGKIKKIYMIGIKGVGMTMLAQFLHGKGFEISGSDVPETFMTDKVLSDCGIKVRQGFSEDNVLADADLIIYSSAYTVEKNPEVARALSSGKKVLTYAEVLGEIFKQMYGVAVCGSHGKTTTTAWLGYVLWEAGKKPNVMVGSRVPQFNGSSLMGDSDLLVIEADEYQNKLKYYEPKMILLNNIDHDHHDFFPTLEDYKKVFSDFVSKLSKKGFLIVNYDDESVRSASSNCSANVISYGFSKGVDYMAHDIKTEKGRQIFKVRYQDQDLGEFAINLWGKHNISNALAVIAASVELGLGLREIRIHLENFAGTERRGSVMGVYNGATIIDDYAHHPTEIKTTLAGIRGANPEKRITVVFHPHTYTRTKALLTEFAESFNDADKVIVLDIYGSAREEQGGVHSIDLVNKMKSVAPEKEIIHIPDLTGCEEYLRNALSRQDLVVLMGAGDVFRIGQSLIR